MRKFATFISILIIAFGNPVFSTAQFQQFGKPFNKVPDRRDVIIYQVNMRAFGKNGDFKGVIERLDSIKALGANVIYLMPIYPVGVEKTSNSPYCIKDYKAINKEFGNLDDLRALVAGAHERKMAVLLDWVANHTSYDNAWTSNKSWYLQDASGNIVSPPGMGWNDVAQLNYKNADMRLAMINAMKYWVYTANVDGFRCDYADGPPVDFWKQAIDTLRNIHHHKLLMLAEGSRNENYTAGFDYNFGFHFFEKMENVYKHDRSALVIDSLNMDDYKDAAEGQAIIRYTTNHDVNSSNGTPAEVFGGKRGSMAAFVVVAYMKSVPMVYDGQEVGTPYRLLFPFTAKKIDWTINPDVTAEYKQILAFRNKSKAIRRGKMTSYTTADVCAFIKQKGHEKVLVISNLRNKTIIYHLPETAANKTWKNVMNGNKLNFTTSVELPAYSYLVLKK